MVSLNFLISIMDELLRRWKVLALKYKRESRIIHDQITEILISMSKADIQKLNLGEANIKETLIIFKTQF